MKMRNEMDYREQLDDFSKFMKRKLENDQLPVDDFCWKEIEFRMRPSRQRWLWWTGSIVAAAVIVLFFLFSPFQTEDISVERPELPIAFGNEEEEVRSDTPDSVRQKVVLLQQRSLSTKKLIAAVISDESHSDVEKEIPDAEVIRSTEKETISKKKPEETKKQQDLYTYESEKDTYPPAEKRKKTTRRWSVNTGFGAGGHPSFGLGEGYDLSYSDANHPSNSPSLSVPNIPSSILPSLFYNPGMLVPEEYTEVDAALPLSFGLTARRSFGRHIGLETGLVYTYLTVNLSKWNGILYKSRLELHYVGIPVNLVVSLRQYARWNIYSTGGFMLEKGLRAKQTEDRFWQEEKRHHIGKRNIKGLQWSLNASIGISYRLYKDWSLYAEPRISYYFDNDQPVSIRTESPVIVGLGAGIRVDF